MIVGRVAIVSEEAKRLASSASRPTYPVSVNLVALARARWGRQPGKMDLSHLYATSVEKDGKTVSKILIQ